MNSGSLTELRNEYYKRAWAAVKARIQALRPKYQTQPATMMSVRSNKKARAYTEMRKK